MGIDNFSKKKKEKNVFKSLFARDSDSESVSSESDDGERSGRENEEEEDRENESSAMNGLEDNLAAESAQDGLSYFQSTINGVVHPLRVAIHEQKVLGIAHQLWPAAGYLCDYLLSHPEELVVSCTEDISATDKDSPLQVIELGAGLGLTGIYLAAFFHPPNNQFASITSSSSNSSSHETQPYTRPLHVVCTDVAEAISGIDENIVLNASLLTSTSSPSSTAIALEGNRIVVARELFWGNDDHVHRLMRELPPSPSPPLIIAADVVYWECLFLPLIQTLTLLCHTYHCEVLIAHIKRWKKDSKFFALCKKHKLDVIVLQEDILHTRDAHHNNPDNDQMKKTIQRIYRIRRALK